MVPPAGDTIDLGALVRTAPRKPIKPKAGHVPPTRRAEPGSHELQTVVITGARRARRLKDTVTQVEVITRKQLQQTSATRLSEVLETHLGIQLTQESGAGTGIQLQGLDSKYILLLIDGQRVNGRLRGVVDLDRFPLAQIERIEIVKGATSALYGSDAIGGVINIITRRSKRPFHADLSSRYGYGGGHLVDLSGATGFFWKGWSGQLALSWSRHDAWDRDPTDIATTGSDDHQLQISGRTSYLFSNKIRLSLWGEYQYRDRAGIDSNSVGAIYDRKNRTETAMVGAFLDAPLGGLTRLRWKTSLGFFRDQFLYEQRAGTTDGDFQQTYDLSVQSVGQFDVGFGRSHVLSVGVDGLYEQIRTPRLQREQAERGRGSLFAQYEWMLEKPIRVSIVPGIRASYDSQYGFAVNPKLSVRIDPVKGLAIRASYGWGFRAPDFKELYLQFENSAAGYVVIGNPLLQPESSRSLQVGVEYSGLKWLTLRANFYRNDLERLINTRNLPAQAGEPLRITYENIDAAVTQGIEAQAVFSLGRWLRFALGYTYLWSQDLTTGLPLLGRSPHRGHFQLFAQVPKVGLRLTVRGVLVGPRPVEDDTDGDGKPERQLLPLYALLHARLGYAFWHRRLEVYVSVQNILDAGDTRWLPIRPRTLMTGLRFSY